MIAIVSNWRDPAGRSEWAELARLTIPNRRAYAERHGYQFLEACFSGHFGKIEALLKFWDVADWLWWLDVDAIITNPAKRLEDLADDSADVVLTCDQHGLNSGSMLIRTTDEARGVLESIRRYQKQYERGPWHDQNGFAYQLWVIRERVRIVDRSLMNSYPDDWRAGDFVLHCPGNSNSYRAKILRQRLEQMDA